MDDAEASTSPTSLAGWLRAIGSCDRIDDLAGLVFQLSGSLSLCTTAGGMLTGPKSASDDLFYFNNWPAAWLRTYQENGLAGRDPAVRWALGSGAPITWLDLRARLDVSDPGIDLFDLAAIHGFVEGYILPVRTTAGHLGLVCMAGDRPPLSPEEQALLQVTGTAAINRAEAITAVQSGELIKAFTARERECAALLVRNLGEPEIAVALGISSTTARFHLDNARVKMRAASRAHLAMLLTGIMQELPIPLGTRG